MKPLTAKAIKSGARVVKERFGVDEDVCTGDHACIRLSGCPSLSVKQLDDLLRDDPVAAIDDSCAGCGNCGEVAEAALLCPSFFRADVIHNPTEAKGFDLHCPPTAQQPSGRSLSRSLPWAVRAAAF